MRATLARSASVALLLVAPASAQVQFVERAPLAYLPIAEGSTNASVAGDVDGDGDLDAVLAVFGQNRLYLNDGTGLLTDATATHFPVDLSQTYAVALGDVDGDGDLDAVWGNKGRTRLYLNDGAGTFADATVGRLPLDGDVTNAVLLADLDGDGDLDVVAAKMDDDFFSPDGAQTRVYFNEGGGLFNDLSAARLPARLDVALDAAVLDIEGDGDLDLYLANGPSTASSGQDRLYLNDGSGSFSDVTAVRLPAQAGSTYSVAAGDVDGDGAPELMLGTSSSSRLFANNGSGSFSDQTVARMPTNGNPGADVVRLFDWNGDGDLDAMLGSGARNRLYLNGGTGVFENGTGALMPPEVDPTEDLAIGDFDGDGDLDAYVANREGSTSKGQDRLYLNEGVSGFFNATPDPFPAVNTITSAVALGDLDGDGDTDVVIGVLSTPSKVLDNLGQGTFANVSAARLPQNYLDTTSMALIDIEGDGDLDLFLGNAPDIFGGFGGENSLYLNDGAGVFTDVSAARLPVDNAYTASVAVGDVDGDGDPDLVLASAELIAAAPRQNLLYLNNGSGMFTNATAARLPVDNDITFSVAMGDLDGDGDLDLVFGNDEPLLGQAAQNRLYLNDGAGFFADVTATALPALLDETSGVALGDLDGDGDLDLVASEYGQNRVFTNDGSAVFSDATAASLPPNPEGSADATLVDLEQDGDLDLLFSNASSGAVPVRVYLNGGHAVFTDGTARLGIDPLTEVYTVAAADVDGDGDPDLVAGVGGPDRLFLNLHRDLETPRLPRVGRPFELRLTSRPGYGTTPALAVVAYSSALLPMPFPLSGFGALYLLPPLDLLPAVVIPSPTGKASHLELLPAIASLAGTVFHLQAALLADGAGSLSAPSTETIHP